MGSSVVEPDLDDIREKLRRMGFGIFDTVDESNLLLAYRHNEKAPVGVVVSRVARLDAASLETARRMYRPVLDRLCEEHMRPLRAKIGGPGGLAAHVFLCDEVDPEMGTRFTRPWRSLAGWTWLPAAFDVSTGEVLMMERVPAFGEEGHRMLVDLVQRLRDPHGTPDSWPSTRRFYKTFAFMVGVVILINVLAASC